MWCICIGVFNLSVPQTHRMLKCKWHHFSSVFPLFAYFTCLPNTKVSALFKSIFRLVEWHSESYVHIFLNTGKPRKKATLLLAQSSFLLRHGPDTQWPLGGRWCCCYGNQNLELLPLPYTVQECVTYASISWNILGGLHLSVPQTHQMLRCKWHHFSSIFPLLQSCKLHLLSGFDIV